jgi:uncharacterized protein YjbJ (UPF0337 family)
MAMLKETTEQKIKGMGEQVAGKAREIGGAVTGDTSEEIRGKFEQVKGKTRSGVAEMVDEMDDDMDRKI